MIQFYTKKDALQKAERELQMKENELDRVWRRDTEDAKQELQENVDWLKKEVLKVEQYLERSLVLALVLLLNSCLSRMERDVAPSILLRFYCLNEKKEKVLPS
jgi:hypothetical protein